MNIIVYGVMGRFSDGVEPTAILVNCHHVTFWQSIEDGHVLIHFLHGSTIEVRQPRLHAKWARTTYRDT